MKTVNRLPAAPNGHRTPPASRPLLIAAILLLCLFIALGSIIDGGLAVSYFRGQDRYVIGLAAMAFCASSLLMRPGPSALCFPSFALPSTKIWPIALLLMIPLLWWGTYALMFNYPLTRDEHMVMFDMAVFSNGYLAQPLEAFWRPYAEALVPAFLLQPDNPAGLVSNYLPGNAALRLMFGHLADPALFNPLLAAIGGGALYDIARREFRGDPFAVATVMLLYLTSAQMLVNAMTCYAMTPHLAFNLIWLAAFLRGGKAGHMLAILVGAAACGLHQIIFHPLFVAPFLLWRLARGEWKIMSVYALAYAVIGLAWIVYPSMAAAQASLPGTATANTDFLHERVLPLLMNRDPNTIWLMLLNLTRFFAWQNLAVLPLLLAAWPVARRNEGIAAPLFAGLLLTITAMTILLPYQGHGWGYRYLHGFIGSLALLGGYGFATLRGKTEGAQLFVTLMTALTLAISLPWLLYQSHKFVMPYAKLHSIIAAQTTPLVLVDTHWPSSMVDQVRNAPDLSNRPIRLSSKSITPEALSSLCVRGPIALITRVEMHRAGMSPQLPEKSPAFEDLVRSVRATNPGCFRAAQNAPGDHPLPHGGA